MLRIAVLAMAGAALLACHPEHETARRLERSCTGGDANACNAFALRLQKGEYVLKDEPRAGTLFDRACAGRIGNACASLAVMYQRGDGDLKRDSARDAPSRRMDAVVSVMDTASALRASAGTRGSAHPLPSMVAPEDKERRRRTLRRAR